jgi:thiamine biosynthesis lipoprotein
MSTSAASAPTRRVALTGRPVEISERFSCFGTTVDVRAWGADPHEMRLRVGMARVVARDLHRRLTRFESDSELSRLNAHPRSRVPASPIMQRFARAVRYAGELTDGLVDGTMLDAIEQAGYRDHWDPGGAGAFAAGGASATPVRSAGAWRLVHGGGGFVERPVGVRLDSGGLGKGLAADVMSGSLRDLPAWLVSCGGDLVLGGTEGRTRAIDVTDPLDPDGGGIHRLCLRAGAVATSGTTARRWAGGHHLIDPRTGAAARTDILQATAIGATGLEAEARAKAALLAGSARAAQYLPAGGVLVTDLEELIVFGGHHG